MFIKADETRQTKHTQGWRAEEVLVSQSVTEPVSQSLHSGKQSPFLKDYGRTMCATLFGGQARATNIYIVAYVSCVGARNMP